MDASDSWIEQCKDGKYLKDGEWHDFTERKETIKRKKGAAIEVTYYENEHGVLEGNPYEEGYYLCTKWSGEKSGANSIKASFQLWDATNVEEGMKILAKSGLPIIRATTLMEAAERSVSAWKSDNTTNLKAV